MAWGRACYDAAEPFPEVVYVDYLADQGDPRVRAAYAANYERLVELKTRYDPTNLFRMDGDRLVTDPVRWRAVELGRRVPAGPQFVKRPAGPFSG